MSRYWTDLVHRLDPYVPGEQPQDQQYVKLNTNENPYPPSPRVIEAIDAYDKGRLKLYPDPESTRLRQALAGRFGVSSDEVFVGNGYSFYPVYCGLYDIEYRTIPLRDDFSIDINDYRVENGGIIFPNPNAPTSRLLAPDAVRELCEHCDSVVIVDEAYIDFGGESAIALTREFDNLLVIQTFSKARSLAGLRLGYAIGQAPLIEGLVRIKNSFNSYPIDSIAQTAALASIEDEAYFNEARRRIIDTRKRMVRELQALGFELQPSAANFVFARHKSETAESLYRELKKRGVLVRYFNKPRIDNHLRITVGTNDEIDRLITTLISILE
jgi:histidinol-phosphate aminotransferase